MMVKVIGPRDPKDPKAINTTSRSVGWSQGLSPFYLGPVELYDGHVAQNMENAWQYSKVYEEHDVNGEPGPLYWDWAKEGWDNPRAVRYPMTKGRKPLYSYWCDKKLTYTEARRTIYIPLYAKAVKKTSAFSHLKMLYSIEGDLVLWDFDAYDHRSMDMDWDDVIDSPDRKCGHGFVLGMLLEGVI